jgi:hypothetical protein
MDTEPLPGEGNAGGDAPEVRAVNLLLFHWLARRQLPQDLVLDAASGLREPTELRPLWEEIVSGGESELGAPLAPACIRRLAQMAGLGQRVATQDRHGRFDLVCQHVLWRFGVDIAAREATATLRKEDLMVAEFRRRFGREPPDLAAAPGLFADERAFQRTLQKVLHFHGAVLVPLARHGMSTSDRILDLASGDGEMSLALALAGYRSITMFDLDGERLERAAARVRALAGDGLELSVVHASALDLSTDHDVLICFQTLEHLSELGSHARASRSCQRRFLELVSVHIRKLAYFNAPNRWYPIDGHDTGKPLFHWLPMTVRARLIERGVVRNSWAGIAEPVTLRFLCRHLRGFRPVTRYYAFEDALDYMRSYPPFDYMGRLYPFVDPGALPLRKRVITAVSRLLGARAQNRLPFLSVVLRRK